MVTSMNPLYLDVRWISRCCRVVCVYPRSKGKWARSMGQLSLQTGAVPTTCKLASVEAGRHVQLILGSQEGSTDLRSD